MFLRLSERKKRKIKNNLKVYLFITGVLLIGIVVFFEMQIVPFEQKCIRKEAKSYAVNLVHKSFDETIKELNTTYSDIADIQYSADGEAKSIETNAIEINRFKSTFMDNFQTYLNNEQTHSFSVPMGAFTEINALTGYGPDIEVNFRLTGSANCRIKSSLESSGINQTIHHIYLVVSVDMVTISPGYSKNIKFTTDYEVAQTVIVGNTPTLYASKNN